MRRLILFVVLFLSAQMVLSQKNNTKYYLIDSVDLESLNSKDQRTIDSLLKVYHTAASDSARISALKALGNLDDFNTSWAYTRKLLDEAKRLLLKKNSTVSRKYLNKILGNSLYNMNYYYSMVNEEDSSMKYLKLCVEPYRLAEDQIGLAGAFQGLGVNAARMGKNMDALDYFQKALQIQEKLSSKSDIASLYINIAVVYRDINEFDKALKYALDALKINESNSFASHLPDNWNQLGIIYKNKGDTVNAIKAYQTSLEISQQQGNRYGIAVANLNLGVIEQNKGDYKQAVSRYLKSLDDFKAVQSSNGVAHTMNCLGVVYQLMGDYYKALEYAKRAHEMNLEMAYPESIMNSAQNLGEIYEKLGRYKEAVDFQKRFFTLKDSLGNADAQREILKKQLDYESEKRVNDLKKEQHEKMLIAEQEKKRQQLIIIFTVAGLITVAVFFIFLFNRFRLIKKQKKIIEEKSLLIEEKNREVHDSISYAKRLQEAILPSLSEVKKFIPNSFVLYQPKDIVAGDFFWMHAISDDEVLFAVADSTGHGVPGALVSVVCSNALNRSVNEFRLTEPGQILDKTRELVSETFEKNNKDVKDGMDISLALLQRTSADSTTIKWAGANNPLWYFKAGEFFEIKPDKQAVGKTENPKPFTTHELRLAKGDSIYLFTDGYADQFGGTNGKKLKYKPFANILNECKNVEPEIQLELLRNKFSEWKGSLEQVDDVCVAGFMI